MYNVLKRDNMWRKLKECEYLYQQPDTQGQFINFFSYRIDEAVYLVP